jgi:molybdenum cofactor cytidylyltransferase
VDVRESTGRILCNPIFGAGGRKLLAKGHVLSPEDVRLLMTEGLGQVWVTELEDGEVGEDEAVSLVASEMACGGLEIRLAAAGGRIFSQERAAAFWWTTSSCAKSIALRVW